VVIVGLILVLRRVVGDLQSSKLDLRELRWGWAVAAIFLYAMGTIPGGIFWYRVLIALGQKPKIGNALRAFFFSQLGKYVPGKAMVVVMRSTMISGPDVRTSVAVSSVFIETLTWMAVGAAIGCALLTVLYPEHSWLVWIGVPFALGSVAGLSPPILGRALKLVRRLKNANEDNGEIRLLDWKTIGLGWLLMSIGWTFVAASMWAVLKAVPGPEANWGHFGVAMESVTLSVVIGIAALIPGGFGVRELVIVPLLTRDFGAPKAFACAILIRLIWLIAEVGIVGIIQLGGKWRAIRSK
jgi:uncharacterized membrane protein YbhN (UPF0104 family)